MFQYLAGAVVADGVCVCSTQLPIELLAKVLELERSSTVGLVVAKGHHPVQVVDVRVPGCHIVAVTCTIETFLNKFHSKRSGSDHKGTGFDSKGPGFDTKEPGFDYKGPGFDSKRSGFG